MTIATPVDSGQAVDELLCSPNRAGAGFIELESVAGKTAVTRCRANSPLRLLTPGSNQTTAHVVVGSYGGGLVGGDSIDLTVRAAANTRCLLGTQASTKIYRSQTAGCRQRLELAAGDRAIIVSLPDPVVCFADSRFDQGQRFELEASASLVMLDWFTSGRAACGERWAMRSFTSHNEIVVNGNCIFRDVLRLDPTDGAIGGPMRMGELDCFATIVMTGPAIADQAKEIVDGIQREPMDARQRMIFGGSFQRDVAVLRIAGRSSEIVGKWIRHRLAFVADLLNMNPWTRKW